MSLETSSGYEIKQYKRRWVNMFVFVLFAINAGCQWLQFTIIKDIVTNYYNVSNVQVEWTTTVYMVAYLLLVPSLNVLDKLGIRKTMCLASAGICVGAWIKLFSVSPDRFYLVLIGQSVEAIFSIFTFGLAARFTAIWFGAHEISRAGAFALFGDQFGTALGFLFPTIMVQNSPDATVVQNGMRKMHGAIAATSTTIFLLTLLLFKDKPKNPASVAQALQKGTQNENVYQALKMMSTNRAFVMITISYALSVGSANALWTLFNEVVLINFPDGGRDAGNVGFVIMCAGMFSSPIFAFVLDKSRKFKENAIFLSSGAFVSILLLSIALKMQKIGCVYIAAIITGIIVQSYYVTGVQMGIEVMYPMSEAISSAIMFCWVQLLGLAITMVYSALIKAFGDIIANVFLCSLFFLSATISFLIPADLKRQKAENNVEVRELKEFLTEKHTIN